MGKYKLVTHKRNITDKHKKNMFNMRKMQIKTNKVIREFGYTDIFICGWWEYKQSFWKAISQYVSK